MKHERQKKEHEKAVKRYNDILKYIADHPELSHREVAKKFNVTDAVIYTALRYGKSGAKVEPVS